MSKQRNSNFGDLIFRISDVAQQAFLGLDLDEKNISNLKNNLPAIQVGFENVLKMYMTKLPTTQHDTDIKVSLKDLEILEKESEG